MSSQGIYVLMLRGTPLKAYERFEAANEAMAEYSAGTQKDMHIHSIRLVHER